MSHQTLELVKERTILKRENHYILPLHLPSTENYADPYRSAIENNQRFKGRAHTFWANESK